MQVVQRTHTLVLSLLSIFCPNQLELLRLTYSEAEPIYSPDKNALLLSLGQLVIDRHPSGPIQPSLLDTWIIITAALGQYLWILIYIRHQTPRQRNIFVAQLTAT